MRKTNESNSKKNCNSNNKGCKGKTESGVKNSGKNSTKNCK